MPHYNKHQPTSGSRHRFRVPSLKVNGDVVSDMNDYTIFISFTKQDGTVIDFVAATSIATALAYYDYTLPTTAAGDWRRKWKFTNSGNDYISEWIDFEVFA